MGDRTVKTGMYRSRWTIAASALLGLVFGPAVANATTTTANDPGAFAALGTIYFSSILHDSGFGGHGGTPSPAGGGSHGFVGGSTHSSTASSTTTTTTGVTDPGTPGVGG